MNILFIGKELDKLDELDNYVNYEFEPKTNIFNKFGKRNTYFDEMKQEFINDINIFGFSPYILQTFRDQRRNPNIKKFIKKKFNYGYTNFVKIRPRKEYIFSSKFSKKIKSRNKSEIIPDTLLTNKEKNKNEKKEENEKNFLQKKLEMMGGHKLNISFDDEKKSNDEDNNDKINIIKKRNAIHDLEFIKDIFRFNLKRDDSKSYSKSKNFSYNNIDIFGNYSKDKANIKMQNINHFFSQNNFNKNKKVLTLSKNKYILGNKKLFSSISSSNVFTSRNNLSNNKSKSFKKISLRKSLKNSRNDDMNKYLLFAKARPYKYISFSGVIH